MNTVSIPSCCQTKCLVVRTFGVFKKIIFSDEANFTKDELVNNENCCIYGEENSRIHLGKLLHLHYNIKQY